MTGTAPPEPRLAVFGSFGFGNAGDEAIPLALADMLAQLRADVAVSVLTRFAEVPMAGIVGMGPRHESECRRLAGVPVVVSGGGVIDPTPASVLCSAEPLIRAAHGRAVVFGGSVEPGVAYGWRMRWRLRRLLSGMSTVYTRDFLSERTLNGLLPKVPTKTVGDLVLWMQPERTPAVAAIDLPSRYIAVVLAPRWQDEPASTAWIAGELAALARQLAAAVVFVPMSSLHDDDRVEHRRVAQRMADLASDVEVHEVDFQLNPREVCELLARSQLTVSMRLHGCVMAYAQRVPMVCLAYHPKLLGFSETMGCLSTVVPSRLPPNQTANTYGYRFGDLGLREGDLLRAVDAAMKPGLHARLDEFKQMSLATLRQLLGQFHLTA